MSRQSKNTLPSLQGKTLYIHVPLITGQHIPTLICESRTTAEGAANSIHVFRTKYVSIWFYTKRKKIVWCDDIDRGKVIGITKAAAVHLIWSRIRKNISVWLRSEARHTCLRVSKVTLAFSTSTFLLFLFKYISWAYTIKSRHLLGTE